MKIVSNQKSSLGKWLLLILILIVMAMCKSSGPVSRHGPVQPTDWMRVATIGGLSVYQGLTDDELLDLMVPFVDQNVTVIEADSNLSDYLTDSQFEGELELMRLAADVAHGLNLKIVWYYPSLESVTVNGKILEHSMYKDHPDWVQLSIDGTENVFYGDLVFWVEPNDESAWLSPLTSYRDYYLSRVEQIVETGIDGLWVDVPLYSDIVGIWPSHLDVEKERFKNDTSFDMPTTIDGSNPVWWRWIQWRHEIIDEFLKEVHSTAREINSDFEIIVETVTMDYNSAIIQALDGSFAGPLEGFTHVWEVDVVSNDNSMLRADHDDWASMIAMYKFGRGADRDRAAWAFTYGYEENDAELVMSMAIASQSNPYELKSPEMTTTVGDSYRTIMFGWIQKYRDLIYRSDSAARIAIFHSSPSRDYIDGQCILADECSTSLYAQATSPDPLIHWWAGDEIESIYESNYMAEYKGAVKAITHLHQPFDIIPSRLATSTILSNYDLIILPDYQALSDSEAAIVISYVQNGGNTLMTGPEPGTRDNFAEERGSTIFSDLINPATPVDTCSNKIYGQGETTYCNYRVGKNYFNTNSSESLDVFSTALENYTTDLIEDDAQLNVYMDVYKGTNQLLLHIVNFVGGDGDLTIDPQTINISLDVSDIGGASSVVSTTPRQPQEQTISFQTNGDRIEFSVTVDIYQAIIITNSTTAF